MAWLGAPLCFRFSFARRLCRSFALVGGSALNEPNTPRPGPVAYIAARRSFASLSGCPAPALALQGLAAAAARFGRLVGLFGRSRRVSSFPSYAVSSKPASRALFASLAASLSLPRGLRWLSSRPLAVARAARSSPLVRWLLGRVAPRLFAVQPPSLCRRSCRAFARANGAAYGRGPRRSALQRGE